MAVKLALFGAGRIGRIHAANLTGRRDAALVRVVDDVSEAAHAVADPIGASVCDADAVFEDPAVEAVLIASPTDTHADLILRAAAAGKAIFCEKPVDLNLERVDECLEAVAAAGVPLFVGFNRRFDPSFAEARRRVRAGAVGDVELVQITSRDPGPPPLDYLRKSGGLFRDMTIHDFDMARWIMGQDPVSVFASAAARTSPDVIAAEDVDTAVITLRSADGALCQITNSRRAAYGYDQRLEVLGSMGMVSVGNRTDHAVTGADAAGYHLPGPQPFFLERYAEAYRREMDAFLSLVRPDDHGDGRGRDLPAAGSGRYPDGMDGRRALALADAAARSLASGRPEAP